jgi:hypothetical protein
MYPYFAVVTGLVWPNDPESNGSGSIAASRTSNTGQFKGDDSDKKVYPGPSGWRLGVRLTNSLHKKYIC